VAGSPSRIEQDLRAFARLQVRAGLLSDEEQYAEVREAIAAELPSTDAGVMSRAWLASARKDLIAEQASWPAVTDHDRLTEAFARLESAGLVVLQGCEDHWAAQAVLDRDRPRAVVWFTPIDVWHAVDAGMLEVNVWHGSSANVAPGEPLLDEVVACFTAAGLEAHYDEGRIEVAARWRRRA
jgi:hypothetical protein